MVEDAAVESWLAITSLLLLCNGHNSGDMENLIKQSLVLGMGF